MEQPSHDHRPSEPGQAELQDRPRVSVVGSALNEESTIGAMIDSIAAQTIPPTEIIIVNDGSTDDTLGALGAAADRHPGLLTVITQPASGYAMGLNRAIEASSGDVIAIADADDWYPDTRLEHSASLLVASDADAVGGQTLLRVGTSSLGTSRFPTEPDRIRQQIDRGLDPLPHTTLTMRRSSIERFGPYRNVTRAADLELMLRWARQGARFAVSPETLATHVLRADHFDAATQFEWMLRAGYARVLAQLDDEHDLDFERWRRSADERAIRHEARRRAARLRLRRALARTRTDPQRLLAVADRLRPTR